MFRNLATHLFARYAAENVLRFEANLMRMGYSSEHFVPPDYGAGRDEGSGTLVSGLTTKAADG